MKYLGTVLLTSILFFSCVPQKQFSDLKKKSESITDSNLLLKEENRDLTVELNELEGKFAALEKKYTDLDQKSRRLNDEHSQLKQSNSRLKNNLNELEDQISMLKEGSSDEISKLLKELQLLQDDLQEREDRVQLALDQLSEQKKNLNQTRSELNQKEQKLSETEKAFANQQARMKELQDALDQQQQSVSMLKEKLNKALRGFYDQGLSVYEKNGKVYVSLEEQLMFKTGSYNLDPKGQEAIKSLAEVLANNPEINIMVEGHTDDVPLSGAGQIKDNWDLSVMRATAVTKIILNNTNIDASRITSSGRGEYVPLDTAKTPEARKKNRRTEIILTPNLSEVFKILQ